MEVIVIMKRMGYIQNRLTCARLFSTTFTARPLSQSKETGKSDYSRAGAVSVSSQCPNDPSSVARVLYT